MFRLYRKCNLCSHKICVIRTPLKRRNCSTIKEISGEGDLDQAYVPHKVERLGLGNDYFIPPVKFKKPFSLVLPPPNITGTLHLGHALTATIEDVIIRWKQMQGVETIWVPGIDHAGIATQVVVEKRLWQDRRKTRHDIGRQLFLEEAWKWKEEKSKVIGEQLRRLGVSLDWDRELFTMDANSSIAVRDAFIKLFDSDLIYRADHLVNWSCVLQSAISDIEVEHLNINGPTNISVPGYEKPIQFGTITKFAYKFLYEPDEEIVVATTRPETMLGDVAVAIHPDDDRYSRYVGRQLWHPFRKAAIPVISDPCVDRGFGTGAVKITPAHNQTDFDIGKRHSLQSIQVIDEGGLLASTCGEFHGLRRFEARDIISDQLDRLGLLRGCEDHQMAVPICSRSKDVIELLSRPQWFLKCGEMATKAANDVSEGKLSIEPKVFEKTWFNWLENIRDWCISRQLWWGHQIPAYLCHQDQNAEKKVWVAAENETDARFKAAKKLGVNQDTVMAVRDEDVLDTWFSSALQPFAAFGWPKQTEDLARYYPLSLMETGHDILFFWVARMVMLGTQVTGQLPFNRILLHGIICDAQGRKMSKSLGNVVAPEDVIGGKSLEDLEIASKLSYENGVLSAEELKTSIKGQKKMFPQGIPECGADALRFTLLTHNIKTHFINFEISECYNNKLFCNKIWQATKFTKLWYYNVSKNQQLQDVPFDGLSLMDKWILSRLTLMVDTVNQGLENYDFHVATAALKNFLYYEFCDVYLETTKRGLRVSDGPFAAGHSWTLSECLDVGLRALAPFMPLFAQHLHRHLPVFPGREKYLYYPQNLGWRDQQLEKDVEGMMEIVVAIRRLKKMFNITVKHKPELILESSLPLFSKVSNIMEDITACQKITVTNQVHGEVVGSFVKDTVGDTNIYLLVPEEQKQTINMDLAKMETKKEKLLKELRKMQKMVSTESYKLNATPAAQENNAKKIATIEEKLSRINYIQNLPQH